jgi:hypothetical protein
MRPQCFAIELETRDMRVRWNWPAVALTRPGRMRKISVACLKH